MKNQERYYRAGYMGVDPLLVLYNILKDIDKDNISKDCEEIPQNGK